MPTESLVSICIPAYNHEKYVKVALDSVLNDAYQNKEIIIIDDGSTDGTAGVIEEWIDDNHHKIPVKFFSRPNKGICATFNELVSHAAGVFITLLASDDYLLENSLGPRVNYLLERDDKFAVIGDAIAIDDNGEILYDSAMVGLYKVDINRYLHDESLRREIIYNWAVPGPVLMVKSEIYKKLGVYNSRLKVEDWDYYLRMVSQNMLGFIPDKVSAYRVHGENFSRKKGVKCSMYAQMIKTAFYNISLFKFKDQVLLLRFVCLNAMAYLKNFILFRCRRK